MREIVLLQKIYGGVSLEEFRDFLEQMCGGLKVVFTDLSVVESGWVRVCVSGDDENAAVNFLDREVGLAPIAAENVGPFSVLRGSVVLSRESKLKVFVDVGVFSPKPVYSVIPLWRLQGQLVDGGKFALERVVELFGLIDDFPLDVRVVNVEKDVFEVELSEGQLSLFGRWVDLRVDRLVALGAFGGKVRKAVERGGLGRDVLGVESLGVLEHVVVCKLGTDGAGLVSKLGKLLGGVKFVVFCPRRVLELVGGRWG